MKVVLGVSNRHVHLTREHLEILFGKGFELTKVKDLNQPTQFMSSSKVTLKTEKSFIENVRVIGDLREYTQIEISKTDAYKLGLNPPVRDSGDLENSETITIVGPTGEVTTTGCIIADRHIHITSKQKELYGLDNVEFVDVLIGGEKGGIISNVHLKVSDPAYYEIHLDTDDANAFLLNSGDVLEIIGNNNENQNM